MTISGVTKFIKATLGAFQKATAKARTCAPSSLVGPLGDLHDRGVCPDRFLVGSTTHVRISRRRFRVTESPETRCSALCIQIEACLPIAKWISILCECVRDVGCLKCLAQSMMSWQRRVNSSPTQLAGIFNSQQTNHLTIYFQPLTNWWSYKKHWCFRSRLESCQKWTSNQHR